MRRHTSRICALLGLAGALSLLGCGGGGELEVHHLDPKAAGLKGQQPVKIHGANFRTDIGYTVYFGNKRADHVTIINPETMVATIPEQDEPGTVDLRIFADTGAGWKVHQAFTYDEQAGGPAKGKSGGGKLKY